LGHNASTLNQEAASKPGISSGRSGDGSDQENLRIGNLEIGRNLKELPVKVFCLAFLLLAATPINCLADLVVRYDFAGSPGNQASEAADFTIAGVTATNIVRGTGVAAAGAGNSITATGWSLGARDVNDYFGLTLTPGGSSSLTLDRMSFNAQRSAAGIRNFEIRSSLDSFGTAIAGTTTSVLDENNVSRSYSFALGAEFANLNSAVTFRIYAYNAEDAGGTMRLTNYTGLLGTTGGLTLDGSVAAVPEPTAFVYGGLIAASLCAWKWRQNWLRDEVRA
jgi:hypothetical protein